jgi:hypothetical protein
MRDEKIDPAVRSFADALTAAYELFLEGCQAECRTLDDITEREYAGMLVQLYGPEALCVLDEHEDASVHALILEAVKDLPVCAHVSCTPKRGFDPERAKNMSPHQVRNIFPPFRGTCPDCGYHTVVFVSEEHEAASE